MKRLTCSLLLLLLIVPAVLAQDEKPDAETDPEVELMHLYAQKGRAWGHRIIHWTRGESPEVENSTSKVTELKGEEARVENETTNVSGTSGSTSTSLIDLAQVDVEFLRLVTTDLPTEVLDMGFRKFKCRKQVIKEDGAQVTTWTSTEFHPLVVKQVRFQGEYTEIRKLSSFDSAEVDPWLLYRMVGRRWKMKMTGPDETIFSECKVVGCDENGTDLEVTKSDADGNIKGETKSVRLEFLQRLRLMMPEGVTDVESAGEEVVTVEAGEFDCYIVERDKTKLYFSSMWAELPVKVEYENVTMELVEFDLGHDALKIYRSAGNSYTTKQVTKFGGMNMESSMTYSVTSVENGTCKFAIISKDANGRETFRSESELDLGEEPEDHMLYTDQVEELVITEAGAFPAIRFDNDNEDMDSTSWMWHGIVIKTVMKMDDIEMVTDLSELNLE